MGIFRKNRNRRKSKEKSWKLNLLDMILSIVALFIGFNLFAYFWFGAGSVGFANAWTKRTLMILSLGIASSSSLFIINEAWASIKMFLLNWLVLIVCMFIAGSVVGFDAGNNAWVAFDAGDFALGINFQLITNSAVVIMAVASLALIIFQVNFAEEGTEQIKAILKGVVTTGFLYLFYTQIFPIVM